MKVHYDCFTDQEEEPAPRCGVTWGEDIETTSNWGDVTCKRCLHRKKKTMKLVADIENHILDDMAGFVEFMETYNKK